MKNNYLYIVIKNGDFIFSTVVVVNKPQDVEDLQASYIVKYLHHLNICAIKAMKNNYLYIVIKNGDFKRVFSTVAIVHKPQDVGDLQASYIVKYLHHLNICAIKAMKNNYLYIVIKNGDFIFSTVAVVHKPQDVGGLQANT